MIPGRCRKGSERSGRDPAFPVGPENNVVLYSTGALQPYNAARAAGGGKVDQTVVVQEIEKLAGGRLGTLTQDR